MTDFAPRYEVLPKAQKAILPLLAEVPRRFVLYGGTAIALQLGHRTSVDFDFFSSDAFSFEELQKDLPWIASNTIVQRAENTLSVIAGKHDPVKLSFLVKEALRRAASNVGEIPEIRRVSDSIR